MEPLAFTRRLIAWRWTPCVAPVTGSVLIALLTWLVVPDQLGESSAGKGTSPVRDKGDQSSDTVNDDAESGATPDATETRQRATRSGRRRLSADSVGGLLHGNTEPPAIPPDPPPQSDPPPPPPAPPENTNLPPEAPLVPPPAIEEPGTLPPPNVSPPPLPPGAAPPNAGLP
jgi:hypothetical protein